jgi:SAM-dependent methyltransferase
MTPASQLESPWYEGTFDRTWLAIYAHRGDEEADREAAAVIERLDLQVDDRILDVACGAGRHARGFARRGLRVTGVDLSEDLLEVAREASPLLPGRPNYMRRDARRLPFQRQFEAAVSMFTSIGYFDGPQDDREIFRGVARGLVRGGRFLLDFLNEAQVRADLVPEEEREVGPYLVRIRRHIADTRAGPAVVKRVEAHEPLSDRLEAAFSERVRLYTPKEIDCLLRAGGLEPVGEPLGDVYGAPFTEQAERYVRIAAAS